MRKAIRRNIQVTSAGWEGFRAIARERGLSLSELIEQIGRRKITLADAEEQSPKLLLSRGRIG